MATPVIAEFVKEELFINDDTTFDVFEVTDVKWETEKDEVSVAEEGVLEEEASAPEENRSHRRNDESRCITSSLKKALKSNRQQLNFLSSSRFMKAGYSVNMVINSTRSLLDDFYLMSQSRKSLYCSKIQFAPLTVMCFECGKQFMGIGDRVLKLSNHTFSKHHKIAEKLFLHLTRRYDALLERMRKFLHMDRHLIAGHYD